MIEAKPEGVTLSGVAEQSGKYVTGVQNLPNVQGPLLFAYESTGIETFFRDGRDPEPRSRRLFAFHQPQTLKAWLAQSETLRARLRRIPPLGQAEQEEPPPEPKVGKGRPKNTPGRNLLQRLKNHENAVLAFALVECVPFTNNQAERDLRPAKVKQKVSGCFRTEHGAKVYARLQAAISTCRKQDRNVFVTLRNLRRILWGPSSPDLNPAPQNASTSCAGLWAFHVGNAIITNTSSAMTPSYNASVPTS